VGLQENYKIHLVSVDNSTEKGRLMKCLGKEANMQFDQDPFAKLQFIPALQDSGAKVGMIGDGLKDAGDLKPSDAGIAISDDLYSFSTSSNPIVCSHTYAEQFYFGHCIYHSGDQLVYQKIARLIRQLFRGS
jgi:Cu+-exporting ATPase